MVRDIFLIGGTVSLLLVGCTAEKPATPSPAEETTLEKEKAPSVMRETKNISYDGIVKPAGISIYQQGTHRLSLPNGKFVLLESETVDLNGYVDEHVRIFGALRPTVEAGGMIMRVERMQLLGDDKDEDTEEEELAGRDETDSGPTSDTAAAEEEPEEEPEEEQVSEDVSEPEEPAETTSAAISQPTVNPAKEARVSSMASQEYGTSNWTQQYCSAHIGFCIPVHRNWWYKSFGTTSSSLWRVELSSEPVERLHDGPIVVTLLQGAKTSMDKSVQSNGERVIGYRTWTDNRHFEISARTSLKPAVSYITEHLIEFTGN